jgi:hypothetical protein
LTQLRLASLTAGLLLSAGVHAATIDTMTTRPFGGYSVSYAPGGNFQVFSPAWQYQLDDGSSWTAGAGWHPPTWVGLSSVSVSGSTIRYRFTTPADGLLFQNTDYDSGEHSAQGQLSAPAVLELVATLGESSGIVSGYTRVVSNDATWYGEPRFNFYSAPVGAEVWFEQRISLLGSSFTAGLFDGSFDYSAEGLVDFTRTAAVPELPTLALLLAGLGLLHRRRAAGG